MKARVTGGVEATYWTGEDRTDIMAPVIVDRAESEEGDQAAYGEGSSDRSVFRSGAQSR